MKNELCLSEGLKLSYEGSRVVSLYMLVREGECIEMLGTNSSGKKALMYFLMGRVPIQAGRFWYRGRLFYPGDFFTETDDVQCMGESPALLEGLSVAENMFLFSDSRRHQRLFMLNRRRMNGQANFLLARYETGIRADQLVSDLDEEDKRVVELLVAMRREVHFLYIDNSFQNFGQRGIRRIYRLLSALKQKGVAILFAGEGIARMSGLSDRVMVIRRGRIVRCFYENDYTTERFLSWMNGSDIQWHTRKKKAKAGNVVLEVKDLSIGRNLRDLSFSIREGEVVGFYDMDNVVNHDLCRAILGEAVPDSGRFYHHGEQFIPDARQMERMDWIKVIPPDYYSTGIISRLSIQDNLALPIMKRTQLPFGLVNERVLRYIAQEDARIGSEGKGSNYLTPAQRLRIAYQRWLIAKPELLICEVPLNESDGEMFQIHQEYIGKISQNGTGIILVSQNYSEMMILSDRILVVNQF